MLSKTSYSLILKKSSTQQRVHFSININLYCKTWKNMTKFLYESSQNKYQSKNNSRTFRRIQTAKKPEDAESRKFIVKFSLHWRPPEGIHFHFRGLKKFFLQFETLHRVIYIPLWGFSYLSWGFIIPLEGFSYPS